MMYTSNFEDIQALLRFEKPGDFYFVQIIKRRKENPDMTGDSKIIRDYFIYSIEDYNRQWNDIRRDCDSSGARAYIRLNVRNSDTIALLLLKRLADLISSGETKAVRNAYSAVCGEYHQDPNKKWIIDLDNPTGLVEAHVRSVIEDLWSRNEKGGAVIAEIQTPNGKHLITTPFDMQRFKAECPTVDVHRDNPTVLYSPFNKTVPSNFVWA